MLLHPMHEGGSNQLTKYIVKLDLYYRKHRVVVTWDGDVELVQNLYCYSFICPSFIGAVHKYL
jgi:hypothetical protein